MLDWTSNPLAALYFAAESESNADGAVFAFRPIKQFTEYLCVYPDEFHFQKFQKHIPEPLKIKGIKIIFPMMSSDRLVAQSGAFTIQNPWEPLEKQANTKFCDEHLDIVEMFKWKLPQE